MKIFIASHPLIDAYKQSDIMGKGIFILLLILSITTWAIFLEKWRLQKKTRKERAFFIEKIRKNASNILALEMGGISLSPYVAIYSEMKRQAGEMLKKNAYFSEEKSAFLSESDLDLVQAQVENRITHEASGQRKHLFVLSTIVSLAPFLGLLGTVWGILLTFIEFQEGSQEVMGGLSMALGTTVLGLLVAIPALLAHSWLKNGMQEVTKEMEDFSHLLLASLELQYRKVDK